MQPNQPGQPVAPEAGRGQRAQAHQPSGATANPKKDEVLYEGVRRHTASFGGYLKWGLVCIVAGVAGYFSMKIEAVSEYPLYLLALVGLPGILWTFLQHKTTKYKVTLRRVECESGVLAKDVDSLELWRVLDVRYNQSLIDRVLGNAKITLITTDQSDPELPLHGLPNHRQLFEQLRDAVQAARHTSRPMELVGQDGAMENVGEY